MQKTATEKRVFSPAVMKSFTFQTTLMKFPKVVDDKDKNNNPIEVFNPVNLNKSIGLLHSYRSETRKEAYEQTAALVSKRSPDPPKDIFQDKLSKVSYEYVTCYQLVDNEKGEMTEDQLWDLLQEQMRDKDVKKWFPYDSSKGSRIKYFHTKYFDHFTMDSLKNGPNNWDILDNQGKKNTIYVHACTAFESVLHIYNYIELLYKSCPQSFPHDKSSKIAVVGAGPSGLLISRKLLQMGYCDVTVYESKANDSGPQAYYAGKTQTNMIDQSTLSDATIPAELGTCYLSPAYKHMYDDFNKSNLLGTGVNKNTLISLDQIENGPIVKSIITDEQFADEGPVKVLFAAYPEVLGFGEKGGPFPAIMDFEKYQIAKGFEEVYKGQGLSADKLKKKYHGFLIKKLGPAAIKYILYHIKNYGKTSPFPSSRRTVAKQIFSTDINSFMKENGFISLLGLLQFGYSLQGYGSTGKGTTMSAFYLMMWVTPDVFMTFIHNDVKQAIIDGLKKKGIKINPAWLGKDFPVIGALSKGWGSVWTTLKSQIEEDKTDTGERKVNIKYDSKISKIIRDKV